MKKLFLGLVVLLSFLALSGCTRDDKHIVIQFVPSQEASAITQQIETIKAALEAKVEGYTFELSVGTSYTAVTEAMDAGQVDVAFLTAQQYAYMTVEMPGVAEVILTSERAAYQVQIDFPGDKQAQINYMNTAAYLGQQAVETTDNYNSICIVKTADFNNGLDSLEDLKGKTCAVQGPTSGAGYIYPSVLLSENNMKFVTGDPNAANGEVKGQQVIGYPAAISALLQENSGIDAAWIFLDARYPNFYLNEVDKDIFTNTKVIAMTGGIYNDTISVLKSMKKDLREKIQQAFIDILADEDVADAVYKIYSHTGYIKANDADYDNERAVYNWKKENLEK